MSVLSLADVRWQSRRDRSGGPPMVRAAFLTDPAEQRVAAVVSSIAGYIASLTGRRRSEYDPDVPVAIAGDRRLAHGLAAVCLDWYRWTARGFADALPPHVAGALARAGVESPSALRLRLFDAVNETYAGFVPSARRHDALAQLAATLGLAAADAVGLETALTLDAETEAVLEPAGPPPSVADVVARYNRATLAALLRHSQRIVFTLGAPDGGLVRRLYAVCRRLGVYCDIEQAGTLSGGFRLTLAGPDAVVGPPAAAGPRLASVALRLLRQLGPEDSAVADLVLRERPYRLALDPPLLRVPGLGQDPAAEDEAAPGDDERADSDGDGTFDSEVEARLAREFAALRRQRRAAGWRLVREPAPLLAGRRVLLPDFALVRGDLRVFVEVAGFWTPGYLVRKRRALEQLPSDTPLVLAVAPPAAAAFAGLPFPSVPYREVIPVQMLLATAEARFGDFAVRTHGAAARLADACAAAADAGFVPEDALARLLGCHSPGEVVRAIAMAPPPDGWLHVPGAGLCSAALRASIATALAEAWTDAGDEARLSLAGVRALLTGAPLPETDDGLTALLERLPESCSIVRDSLFLVEVRPPGVPPSFAAPPGRRTMKQEPRQNSSARRTKTPARTPTLF